MANASITAQELRERLDRAGHFTPESLALLRPTDVWPTPETIVTVGIDCDPTLMPPYRQRYFVCYYHSKEEPAPFIRIEPAFALSGPMAEAARKKPNTRAFVEGPIRWLLPRLEHFGTVLVWPGPRDFDTIEPFARPDRLLDVPLLLAKLPPEPTKQVETGAIVLDLEDVADCLVFWEIATRGGFDDFFASDLDCREVYLLHHHDKVVVSIPKESSRRELLEDLASWDELIKDCSNYTTKWDDEDDEGSA